MGCFVVMIVGMVDDRAMRFRQQAAAPAPKYSAPSNYRYGEATAPKNIGPNVVTDFLMPFTSETMRSGGEVGAQDLLKDAAMYAAGGLIGKGVGAGIKTVGALAKMSPENRALYAAMQRGLYHGSRDTGAATAKPFTLANRDSGSWQRNWFGGDMFGATGKNVLDPKGRQVAEGYTQSAAVGNTIGTRPQGLTASGFPVTRGAKFRLSEPANAVANRKILDLTEGTLDQVDPALYQRLVNEFKFLDSPVDNIYIDELAKMNLGGYNGGLHKAMYSNAVRPVIEDAGYDTIKHLSGQLQGDIVTPVYAFLNPAGMKATPTLPSLGRLGDVVDARISNVAQKGAEATGAAGAAIKEGGASALDSLAVALNRENMSSLPAPVRDFVAGRTAARGSGENFADIRQFNQNPQLVAFLKKLGLDKLWADAPEAARNLVEPAL